jgi:2-dehydropantoate 2-reductase
MKKILVVGAGSIGTLIGASLVQAGLEVTFVGRSQSSYTKQIKQFGITLSYPSGEIYSIAPDNPKVRFVDTTENLAEIFDVIIVAVKSNHLASVAPYIRDHSNQHTLIVHAQNGIPYWWFVGNNYRASLNPNLVKKIGSYPYLESIDPDGQILATLGDRCLVGCVVKAPCSKTKLGYIEVKKPPKMLVGLVNPKQFYFQKPAVEQLCELLSNYGLETTYKEKIRAEVCNKLAINLATNVLAALTGCVISELTANPLVNSLIITMMAEIKQIFLTYGIERANLPSEAKVYAYITEPGSQRHLPSLAQDFARHQPGEIDLITAPLEMAEIAGIRTPIITSLAKLLQFGQNYALDSSNEHFNILTFEETSGYCLLTDSVYQSQIVDNYKISELVTHLVQINVAAKEPNLKKNVA